MENTIPVQAQQAILSLQADVQYYNRRAQEAQREITGILGQLGLPSVQMVVVPAAPDVPTQPLALVPKIEAEAKADISELPAPGAGV